MHLGMTSGVTNLLGIIIVGLLSKTSNSRGISPWKA